MPYAGGSKHYPENSVGPALKMQEPEKIDAELFLR
jgi:hypothetical protein